MDSPGAAAESVGRDPSHVAQVRQMMTSHTEEGGDLGARPPYFFRWQQYAPHEKTGDSVTWYQYTWQEAIDYCDALELAGHTDWYLPSIKEIQTLLNYGCRSDAMLAAAFRNDPVLGYTIGGGVYWTSTTRETVNGSSDYAWHLALHNGFVDVSLKTIPRPLLAVRRIGGE